MIDVKVRGRASRLLAPVGRVLARLGLRPAHVTVAGLVVTVVGSVLIATGSPVSGAIVVVVGSAIDALDGAVARARDMVTRRGAFLDATTDRLGETAMWAGLGVAVAGQEVLVALVVLSLGASLTTSYLRAKVESEGVDGKGGLMGRAERVILYGVGVGFGWIQPMLWAMVVLTWSTVARRFYLGWKRIGR